MAGRAVVVPMRATDEMIAVGEESGSLDHMASKVADFYELEVDSAVDGMASLMIEKGIIDEKELAARTKKILAAGTRDHAG